MGCDILSTADTKAALRRFRSTVCELLCLPAHVGEFELRAALTLQGDESLRWYENRCRAIREHCAARRQTQTGAATAGGAQ